MRAKFGTVIDGMVCEVGRVLLKALALWTVFVGGVTLLHFPTTFHGPAVPAPLLEDTDSFYEAAYTDPGNGGDTRYVKIAQTCGHSENVEPKIRQFVDDYGLENARILEVGAGSGTLQDVVADYTGLDIAASAARYFHKPFVHGSATDLPFRDNEFDSMWSIWTLEHVANPEQALREMRRVTRSGGYLYLYPTWNNPTWAPKGYPVRPFAELTWLEKVDKASLLLREMGWFKASYHYPTRMIRLATAYLGGPTALRYREVDPNFDTYWIADADAVNSMDCFEAQLWFESRGDRVSNRHPATQDVFAACEPLIIQVRKPESRAALGG